MKKCKIKLFGIPTDASQDGYHQGKQQKQKEKHAGEDVSKKGPIHSWWECKLVQSP